MHVSTQNGIIITTYLMKIAIVWDVNPSRLAL